MSFFQPPKATTGTIADYKGSRGAIWECVLSVVIGGLGEEVCVNYESAWVGTDSQNPSPDKVSAILATNYYRDDTIDLEIR